MKSKTINITYAEAIFQFCIILFSIWAIGWVVIYFDTTTWAISDTMTYYRAAIGDYNDDWVYKDYWRFLFLPMHLVNFKTAFLIWAGLQTISFITLTHYLFKVKYGWIFILAALPAYKGLLQCGNIDAILALAFIYPVGSVLAGILKPHLLVFTVLHAIRARYRARKTQRSIDKVDTSNIHTDSILPHNEG